MGGGVTLLFLVYEVGWMMCWCLGVAQRLEQGDAVGLPCQACRRTESGCWLGVA